MYSTVRFFASDGDRLSASANASQWRCLMIAKYDIFKKTSQNNFVWVEAVEDIVAAKKRLVSLASTAPNEYRLWDSAEQKFVDPLEDCA
jgi:hypothetical protein